LGIVFGSSKTIRSKSIYHPSAKTLLVSLPDKISSKRNEWNYHTFNLYAPRTIQRFFSKDIPWCSLNGAIAKTFKADWGDAPTCLLFIWRCIWQ
jgi:hypothetical protein